MPKHKHLMILFLWLYFISLSVSAAATPNKFTFIDQTDVALNTAIISNTITVSGIDTKTTISITGGSFSVNGAAYRTSKTTLLNGATVSIKQTSSKLNDTKKNAVLSVVGNALTDANFVSGSDEITYRIPNLTGSNYTVESELLHQPLAYSFAQDLFSETSNEGDDFKTMFNASNSKTSRIALNTFSVVR